MTFADSKVQDLFCKPMFSVAKDGSSKFIQQFLNIGRKICLRYSIFIFCEFISVNLSYFIVCKAKVSFAEVNRFFTCSFSCLVSNIYCIDQAFVTDHVILSFKEKFLGQVAHHCLKDGIRTHNLGEHIREKNRAIFFVETITKQINQVCDVS